MASNSINAFEGKLLEALNILPQMGKSDRSEALRLFAQTAQFFHLQQEQQQQQQQPIESKPIESAAVDGFRPTEDEGSEDENALFSPHGQGDANADFANEHPTRNVFGHSGLGPPRDSFDDDPLSSMVLIENTEFQRLQEEDVALMIARRHQLEFDDLNLESRSLGMPSLLTPTRPASSLLTPTRPGSGLTPVPLVWTPTRSPRRSPNAFPARSPNASPARSPNASPARSPNASPAGSPKGWSAVGLPSLIANESLNESPERSSTASPSGAMVSLCASPPGRSTLSSLFQRRDSSRSEEEVEEGDVEERREKEEEEEEHVGEREEEEEREVEPDAVVAWSDDEELPFRLTHFSDDEEEEEEEEDREIDETLGLVPNAPQNEDVGGDRLESFDDERVVSNDGNRVDRGIDGGAAGSRNDESNAHSNKDDTRDNVGKGGLASEIPRRDADDEVAEKINFGSNSQSVTEPKDDKSDHGENRAPPRDLESSPGKFASHVEVTPVATPSRLRPPLDSEKQRELAQNASIGKIGSLLRLSRDRPPGRVTTRKLGLKWAKDGKLIAREEDGTPHSFARDDDDDDDEGLDVENRGDDDVEVDDNNRDDSGGHDPSQDKSKSSPDDEFVCPICDKKIASGKGNFAAHLRRHDSAPKPFTCGQCGAGYQTKQNLQRHERSKHLNLKPFKCDRCGKRYGREETLKVHLKTHLEEKSFICNECGKSFHTNDYLKDHLKMHAGVRDFLCDFCGKGFLRYNHWKVHMKRHRNEKNYSCDGCDKTFVTNADLLRHKWVHKRHLPKSQYPFQCSACDAAFIRPEVLNDHMNFHKGIRPYKCNVCPKTYSDRSGLMRHRKQHELKKKREEMVEAKTVQLENLKHSSAKRASQGTNILLEAAILSEIDGGRLSRASATTEAGDDETEVTRRSEAASALAKLQDQPSLKATTGSTPTSMDAGSSGARTSTTTTTTTTSTSGLVTLTADGFDGGWTLIDPKDVDANNAIFEASETIIHAQDGTIFQTADGTIVAVEGVRVVRVVDRRNGGAGALRGEEAGGVLRGEESVLEDEANELTMGTKRKANAGGGGGGGGRKEEENEDAYVMRRRKKGEKKRNKSRKEDKRRDDETKVETGDEFDFESVPRKKKKKCKKRKKRSASSSERIVECGDDSKSSTVAKIAKNRYSATEENGRRSKHKTVCPKRK